MEGETPRDAKLLGLILQSMDVEDYQDKVIPQLLDFSHSKFILTFEYVLDILTDAQLFAEHANRQEISIADVKLAIEGKLSNSFTYPPSRDVLNELASKKNSQPLPVVPEKFGVRLPPERHCLTAVNFDILPEKKVIRRIVEQIKAPVVTAVPVSGDIDMPDLLSQDKIEIVAQEEMDQDEFDF